MKVISKAEILETTIKTKRDGFCTKCNKDAVKKAVSEAKEFDAIPLDRIKQAREEIEQLKPNNPNFEHYIGETRALNQVLEILDRLIESET